MFEHFHTLLEPFHTLPEPFNEVFEHFHMLPEPFHTLLKPFYSSILMNLYVFFLYEYIDEETAKGMA